MKKTRSRLRRAAKASETRRECMNFSCVAWNSNGSTDSSTNLHEWNFQSRSNGYCLSTKGTKGHEEQPRPWIRHGAWLGLESWCPWLQLLAASPPLHLTVVIRRIEPEEGPAPLWVTRMTKEQAIEIAQTLAKSEGMRIGDVLNVLYDPIIQLDELWEPTFADSKDRPKQWRIMFDLPDSTMDPGFLRIAVNDQTGRAVIIESL